MIHILFQSAKATASLALNIGSLAFKPSANEPLNRTSIKALALTILTFLCTYFFFPISPEAQAESSSPATHWGGLTYPDQYSKLELGYLGNRFTEFDGDRRRYNNIRETMGLNFGSVSWTEHWKQWKGWSTNLTVGAGPTGEQPTRYLQNEFIHDAIFGIPRVPVRRTRDETDFMIDGSVTRWIGPEHFPRIFFIGAGLSAGSLYFEEFARAGIRHLPLVCILMRCDQFRDVAQLLKGFHVSGLGKVSGVQSGAAFHDLAPQTYLAQASVGWGIYDMEGIPFFDVEFGYTLDSGIFRDFKGNSLEERFWSLGFKIRHFSFETWNDQANRKDNGPTYGLRIAFDVYPFLFGR